MKLYNVQGLRAIAVVLVLFSHMFRVEEKYSATQILPGFFLSGISGVDLFFVISGFIMVVTTKGQFGAISSSLKFIYKRASRIFPLYIFYTLIVLVVALIVPSWVNSGANYDLVSSLLLLPHEQAPLLAVGWTLIHEMYFYYIFLLFLLFPEKYLAILFALWAAAVLLANIYLPLDTPLLRLVFSPLTLEFIAGGIVGLLYLHKQFSVGMKTCLAVVGCSFGATFVGADWFSTLNGGQPSGFWRVVIFGLPSCAILYCTLSFEGKGLLLPEWMIKVGDSSYSVYLSHVLVLSALGRIFYKVEIDGVTIDNIAVSVLLAVACLVFGWLSYVFLEKPALNGSRKLYGFLSNANTVKPAPKS